MLLSSGDYITTAFFFEVSVVLGICGCFPFSLWEVLSSCIWGQARDSASLMLHVLL